ncbi:MAG: OmpH family outer membrane protein [Bacteroidales bacterium]|nr:OmpH family outer membrane protein [Bacteroidales bacterium]
MKVLLRLSIVVFFLTTAFGTVSAQKLKFGHTNSQKLVEEMPETKKAREELQTITEKHKKRFEEMQAEYQQKYTEILENSELADESPEKWDELTMEDKQAEFMSLQQRIQAYEQNASEKINQKQVELFTPITEKVQNAIKAVAEEEEFIYIFDESTLLYFSKTQSIDVTDKIKKKLAPANE